MQGDRAVTLILLNFMTILEQSESKPLLTVSPRWQIYEGESRSDPITLTVSAFSFPLGITLGALGFLIGTALILILFMKHCRNQGLPCIPCAHSDNSSVQTLPHSAAEMKFSPEGQLAAKSYNDVTYSNLPLANKTKMEKKEKMEEKNTEKSGGHYDVVYSILALDVTKKKKEKNTESSDHSVVYSTVRTG
ncbi:hypothetical protein MATL_G00235720 [Megalops atlanticus]|uniref:Uncharacterized protein n=1 Tax=Megalops atlanticus TaxID=7932 RepID=A0A9D3SWQ3_MEGAT|nr:hypothetical protein MATL_G00235720 [Megalops atlanticus]